jgi:hypothetical protein
MLGSEQAQSRKRLRDLLSVTCRQGCACAQSLANGGVVFVDAGRGGASRVSATAALKHRFMAQVRPCVPAYHICGWRL